MQGSSHQRPPQLSDTAPVLRLSLSGGCYHRKSTTLLEAALQLPVNSRAISWRQVEGQACKMQTQGSVEAPEYCQPLRQLNT